MRVHKKFEDSDLRILLIKIKMSISLKKTLLQIVSSQTMASTFGLKFGNAENEEESNGLLSKSNIE